MVVVVEVVVVRKMRFEVSKEVVCTWSVVDGERGSGRARDLGIVLGLGEGSASSLSV